MQQFEILYNLSFTANTFGNLVPDPFLPPDGEGILYNSQQNLELSQDYYTYLTQNGIGIVNDLNVKTFLNKPENEKIALEFLSHLTANTTYDEFRDLFYDNKKLADYFNEYYKKYILYSNRGLNSLKNDPTINLEQVKLSLFNEDEKYLKTNANTNYYAIKVDNYGNTLISTYSDITRTTDLINFSGYNENYYINVKVQRNIKPIFSDDFSDYFKNICDGTYSYTKYNYMNTFQKNFKCGNYSEILEIQRVNKTFFGPTKENLQRFETYLPVNYQRYWKEIRTGEVLEIFTPSVTLEDGVYNDNLINQIIYIPEPGGDRSLTNFRTFNEFAKWFYFQYKNYSPNFQTEDECNQKYIYSQILLQDSERKQLLQNNKFFNAYLNGTYGWWGRTAINILANPNSGLGPWWDTSKVSNSPPTSSVYSNGSLQPLWQEVPEMQIGKNYKIEITISGNTNNTLGIKIILGLGYSGLMRDSLSTISNSIKGNGTFTIFQKYNGGNPGLAINADRNWGGFITEINLYEADDINWYYDYRQNSLDFKGKLYDPINTNNYKIKYFTLDTPPAGEQKKAIVQYEYFSQSLIGPDDGTNAFSFVIPNETDLSRSSFEIFLDPGETQKEFEINIYKNWEIRKPIVLSLREYLNPSKVTSYLIIFLEEFYELSTYSFSDQIMINDFIKCKLFYNGFVDAQYNDNFLEYYRNENIPIKFGPNTKIINKETPITDQEVIINDKLYNTYFDKNLNLNYLSSILSIPKERIYNIYVFGDHYFGINDLNTLPNLFIVADINQSYYKLSKNGVDYFIYSPEKFTNELNSYIVKSETKSDGLLNSNVFQIYNTEISTFKIFEGFNFEFTLKKSEIKTKTKELIDEYLRRSEIEFNSGNINYALELFWIIFRTINSMIQVIKTGKIKNIQAANSYKTDIESKEFTSYKQYYDYLNPQINGLYNQLLTL